MFYCPQCGAVITKEAHEKLFCENCGLNLALIQLQPTPHPFYKTSRLIRPIGTSAQQKPSTPTGATPPDIHIPTHLLALSSNPSTSPATATPNIQAPPPNPRFPHQLIRPPFIPPTEETLKTPHYPDQQTQHDLAHPGPNSSFWPRQVQIQSLQLSQLSQLSQSSQAFHPSNSLLEPPTLDPESHSKQIPIEIVKGNPYAIDTNKGIDQPVEDEGFIATSAAAEHWRTSWRNRQRSEAGPAAAVSRGQSSVPEPLMAMQHSLQRIRAITRSQIKKEGTGLGFWMTLFFMVCIIGILGAYIASTYLPNSYATSHDVSLSTSQLTFEAVINQDNPKEQFVKLTNSSSTASIHWTATVFADDNLDWLSINASTTSGILHAGDTVTVGINASITDLKSNVKPYTGHILFTVNQAKQLTLPVELYVRGGIAKIVMSPVSMIGVISKGS